MNHCTWTKAQRTKANVEDKVVFACGYAWGLGSQNEVSGVMDADRASVLFCFALLLYQGKTPDEAWAEMKPRIGAHEFAPPPPLDGGRPT
jgi:hypothetical protein